MRTAIGEADGPLSVGRQYDWLLRVSRRAKPCKGVCEWDTSVPPRYDPLLSHPLERPGCGSHVPRIYFSHPVGSDADWVWPRDSDSCQKSPTIAGLLFSRCASVGNRLSFRHNRRTATVQSRTPDRVG